MNCVHIIVIIYTWCPYPYPPHSLHDTSLWKEARRSIFKQSSNNNEDHYGYMESSCFSCYSSFHKEKGILCHTYRLQTKPFYFSLYSFTSTRSFESFYFWLEYFYSTWTSHTVVICTSQVGWVVGGGGGIRYHVKLYVLSSGCISCSTVGQ